MNQPQQETKQESPMYYYVLFGRLRRYNFIHDFQDWLNTGVPIGRAFCADPDRFLLIDWVNQFDDEPVLVGFGKVDRRRTWVAAFEDIDRANAFPAAETREQRIALLDLDQNSLLMR